MQLVQMDGHALHKADMQKYIKRIISSEADAINCVRFITEGLKQRFTEFILL